MEGTSSWAVITGSAIGKTHVRKGTPNQDAVGFYQFPGSGSSCVLAVSDGHGSEKCARSEIGSSLAVNSAIKVFIEFWQAMKNRELTSSDFTRHEARANSVEKHIRTQLLDDLVSDWQSSVENHILSNPLEREVDDKKKLLVYGATLTVVFLADNYGVFLRLGDGEILTVDNDDNVERFTVDAVANIGEDTDSLCMPDASSRFNVKLFSLDPTNVRRPGLILACTDGFNNAFKSNRDFESTASDFYQRLKTLEGQMEVKRDLHSWLDEFSDFSGDDVTVGVIFNDSNSARPTEDAHDHPGGFSRKPDACPTNEGVEEHAGEALDKGEVTFLDEDQQVRSEPSSASNLETSECEERELHSRVDSTKKKKSWLPWSKNKNQEE